MQCTIFFIEIYELQTELDVFEARGSLILGRGAYVKVAINLESSGNS